MVSSLLGPTRIDDRFELLSEGWYAAAQVQLNRQARRYAGELAGKSFDLSEIYLGPPSHISSNATVGWSLSLRDGAFTVSKAGNPNATWHLEADYQQALPFAQAVGKVAREHALREIRNYYGAQAVTISGTEPDGIIGDILRDMRDHQARLTLENPDIRHRIRSQHLECQVAELEERGYSVIENAISPDMCDELRRACLDEAHSHHSGLTMTGRIDNGGLLVRGRMFEEIVQVPWLRTLMEAALGPGMILHTVGCAVTRPGPGGIGVHSDYEGLGVMDPYPEPAILGTAVWALEDWTEAAGPTWVVPGSHLKRRAPFGDELKDHGVPILMPKGSVTFFTHGVWHSQGVRTMPSERVSLNISYTRPFIRQADDFSDIDVVLHRHSPIMSQLTGNDNHLGRTTHAGHDLSRVGVLRRNMALERRRRRESESLPTA